MAATDRCVECGRTRSEVRRGLGRHGGTWPCNRSLFPKQRGRGWQHRWAARAPETEAR